MSNISCRPVETHWYRSLLFQGFHATSSKALRNIVSQLSCTLTLFVRYPVILEHFSLRPASGGAGKYHGGDGVIRKLLFRDKVVLSVLSERRATRPYGLEGKHIETDFKMSLFWNCVILFNNVLFLFWSGGEAGAAGLNLLHRADGRVLNLGAKTSVSLQPGVGPLFDELDSNG